MTTVLNLANAGIGVGVIAFINHRLLDGEPIGLMTAYYFVGLIVLLFVLSFVSQYALTWLGHRFVYELRLSFIRKILSTDIKRLEAIGQAPLLASLSVDIQAITMAFVRLPELVQGVIVCLACAVYLFWLSPILMMLAAGWLGVTVVFSLFLVKKVYAYLENLRKLNDEIYAHYQSTIDGAMPLKLNRHRAKVIFANFANIANTYRHDIIRADSFHISAVNVSNIMVFFGIGVLLIASDLLALADKSTALTASLVMLFVQSPLLKAVGAYPVIQSAQVGFEKMQGLNLANDPMVIEADDNRERFQHIAFRQVYYRYDDGRFALSPIDFKLNAGEIVFLVGGNGSGKTTLAKLLVGLYVPTDGQIFYNGKVVTADVLNHYQQNFSAIFSEVYLFNQLLGKNGQLPDEDLMNEWLHILQLDKKIEIHNHIINTTKLSQGQKKRLALLIALCEQKPILLLDEWAADQDPEYRQFFYDNIIPKLKAMGKTLFVISHDDRFFGAADRILVMKEGVLHEIKKG